MSLDRRPELDGLRGIAVLLVIAQHYVIGPLGPSVGSWLDIVRIPGRVAWTGVDLFFVLSGYLIGSILLANRDAPAYFRTFYIRRACRILPLYLAVLAVFYVFNERVWHTPRPPLLQYLTFTQNFGMAAEAAFTISTLALTWSLAVEEQFYLTLPALIRFTSRRWLMRIIVLCIALAPVLRYAGYLVFGTESFFGSHIMLFTRMDTLLLGVLAALLQANGVVIPRRVLYPFWTACGALILLVAWNDPTRPLAPLTWILFYDLIALFYASTLLIAVQGGFRFLRLKPLAYTGLISYGLYLLHQAVNFVVRGLDHRIQTRRDVLLTTLSFAIVYVLAALSWELFEKRFVEYGHRYRYER